MPRFTERLAKLERRLAPGTLPTIFVVPADEPDRTRVLADIERRRVRGQNIVAIGEADDWLDAMVEAVS